MTYERTAFWVSPKDVITRLKPIEPLFCFSPLVLQDTAVMFMQNFPGLVTYAVKANDSVQVLQALVACGIDAFDVASPDEIDTVREICPSARLHYHNPVRAPHEVQAGLAAGVASWSVDDANGLAQIMSAPKSTEIAVRFCIPHVGGAYDFGEKFGATPDRAAELLKQAAEAGFVPSLTFHPGTECHDFKAWARYIKTAAEIAKNANVRLKTLNIGGGFPAKVGRDGAELLKFINVIKAQIQASFGEGTPNLVCEPGRAMVSQSYDAVLQVKAIRETGDMIWNDGIYGSLAEWRDMTSPNLAELEFLSPQGERRVGPTTDRTIFGPTCDSLDKLPVQIQVPSSVAVGDYVIARGMGAYAQVLCTAFNGYGAHRVVICQNVGK